jgi:ankyrin repeat protein
VELKEKASWEDLKIEIEKVTGTWQYWQKLKPSDFNFERCKLEEGDDIFCDWESHGYIPLHHAAFAGNVEAIRSWIASGADVNATGLKQKTPLMCACVQSSEECVSELLRLGADVHMIDENGETALHKIVCDFNLEKMERMVKTLIKAGCNPTISNNGEIFVETVKRRNYKDLELHLVVTPPNGVLLETDATRPFETIMEEWLKDAKK